MYKYCPQCASELLVSDRFRHAVPYCVECGFFHFGQPKVAVAMLAESADGLLLVRRDIEPMRGRWTFPSGYVDRDEPPAEAAIRETEEETGAVVVVDDEVGVYWVAEKSLVLIVYYGRVVGGEIRPRDETQAVCFVRPGEHPPLAFPHDEEIVRKWQRRREAAASTPAIRAE